MNPTQELKQLPQDLNLSFETPDRGIINALIEWTE